MAHSRNGSFVSVVTVVRNDLEGLKRTMESILRQSSTDFEWIIIDGYSSDGTEILGADLSITNTARVITVPPNGIYDAMNHGITNSKGDYLIFLNAGDFFISELSISILVSLIQSHGQSVAFPVIQLNSRGSIIDVALPDLLVHESNSVLDANHQGFVMKKSVAASLGNFDLSLKYAADGKLMDRVATLDGVTIELPIITAFVVGGASSINISKTLKEINAYRTAFKRTEIFVLTLKTILRNKAYVSNNIFMVFLNQFLMRKADRRIRLKLNKCVLLEHWHSEGAVAADYKCCMVKSDSSLFNG